MLLGQVILYCCRFRESLIRTAFLHFVLFAGYLHNHLNEHFQPLIQYRLNLIFILIIHAYVRLTPIASLPVFLRIEVPPTQTVMQAVTVICRRLLILSCLQYRGFLTDGPVFWYCIKMYGVTTYLLYILCVLVVVGSVSMCV